MVLSIKIPRGRRRQLASQVGVHPSVVSRWLSGKARVPAERTRAVAEFLSVPPQELRPDLFAATGEWNLCDETIVTALGGPTEVAEALGLSRASVSNWRLPTHGIPSRHLIPLWCLALERGVPWTPPGGERLAALLRTSPAPAAPATMAEAA